MNSTILTYQQIINSDLVTKFLPYNCDWWKDYIYHFSDVQNIANILESGYLYSRNMAILLDLMRNNNASEPVMNGTSNDIKNFVRFYFRPLTPTQFRNEGIRAKDEIHIDHQAHCPIPVFLLFDSIKMLERKDSQFTYEGLASNNVEIYDTIEDFIQAPFKYIYHKGSYNPDTEGFIKKNRQAELIIPNQCDLKDLNHIVCRTIAEKETLIDLLSPATLSKYKEKIVVIKNSALQNMFIKKHLIIESVELTLEKLKIKIFNPDEYQRHIKILIHTLSNELIITGETYGFEFNQNEIYLEHFSKDKLKHIPIAKICIYIDDNLVYSSNKIVAE